MSSWVRNAKRPSAMITAGRAVGIASSQFGSVRSVPTPWAFARSGISCRRAVITSGKSTSYQSTVYGGGDAQHPGVQPGTQVERDRVGVAGDEPKRHLVQFLGPKRDVDDGARAEAKLAAVVVKLSNDLIGHRVGED